MFRNPKNNKLYPDYRDEVFVTDCGEIYYIVPSFFKESGQKIQSERTGYYTKKQLEKMKLKPMDKYYGMKWFTNSRRYQMKYYYCIECTEEIIKEDIKNEIEKRTRNNC